MKAKVDKDSCIGYGICTDICPEVFAVEDDGKAAARVEEVPPETESRCRDAAEQCPSEAITIEDQ